MFLMVLYSYVVHCWRMRAQEELAAVNLAKYRKAQSDLDEAEERLEENAAELSLRSRLKNTMTPTTAATRQGAAGVRPLYLLTH